MYCLFWICSGNYSSTVGFIIIRYNENFMEENIMNDFKPPKFIKFPSDLRGIRYKNGKEEVKILCSDGEYHWIDSSRYKNR